MFLAMLSFTLRLYDSRLATMSKAPSKILAGTKYTAFSINYVYFSLKEAKKRACRMRTFV
jgi:hypothetical protein